MKRALIALAAIGGMLLSSCGSSQSAVPTPAAPAPATVTVTATPEPAPVPPSVTPSSPPDESDVTEGLSKNDKFTYAVGIRTHDFDAWDVDDVVTLGGLACQQLDFDISRREVAAGISENSDITVAGATVLVTYAIRYLCPSEA